MYSDQIKFSKQFDNILAFQVDMQVQSVYWNIYAHNQMFQKALTGQIKLNEQFKDIYINVERTYNQTEDPIKLEIFKRSYLLVNSWFQRDKYFLKDLDPIQQQQLLYFSATDPLFRAILYERDEALHQNITRRFYIKNMYTGTQYDGMVIGPSANTTYRNINNPSSCPSGNIYDSRCRYWFNDTIHRKNISLNVFPPQLQYSNVGIPFLASVFCQRIELPPYIDLDDSYSPLGKKGNLYSVLCNNLDLTAAGIYFSSFNQKSAFKMLIDPSSQIAVYYSLFQLNSTQNQQTLNSLELNVRTTQEQAQLFQDQLTKLYSNPILNVQSGINTLQLNDDTYQKGFTFFRLNNPSNLDQIPPLTQKKQGDPECEEIKDELKEHYAIVNTIKMVQKLKDPWNQGYSINSAFILIDVLSKDMLTVQAQQMQDQINKYCVSSLIALSIFYFIIILLVIIRFIRIFKLIISPINQLTNILKSVQLDDIEQISQIFGDKQIALESLFEQEIFLSKDTKILYESIVSLFKMVQFTQSNIFVQTESQTLLNLNEQITHFQKFQNHRALGICHNNIGYIHFNAHRYQEALQEFSQAIIYSNYEVKIYEEDMQQSQLGNNSRIFISEVTRNIKLLSNYKNLINQINQNQNVDKEEKTFRKSAFSSGTSLIHNKKLQQINRQNKKDEKLDQQQIIHYEVQSESSLSQVQINSQELQKQQNNQILNTQNKQQDKKKTTIQQVDVNQENVQSQKLSNSQYLLSSQSLQKKRDPDKRTLKSKLSIKKNLSLQQEKSLSNSYQKHDQVVVRKKNITESLSPSRSITSRGIMQDNDITNLFFCLYSRKFNYAKALFMLLERQNETFGNMWTELEQLLLEIIEIGNQMTLVNQIKSFQFNCYVYLILISKRLSNSIKLAQYIKSSYEILQEVLNDQIQQDIYQEAKQNSNRTLKSEFEYQSVFINEDLLKNREYVNDYSQNLIVKTQILSQYDINSTQMQDTQKVVPSLKAGVLQKFNQHSQFIEQNPSVNFLLSQFSKNTSIYHRNTSISDFQKKQLDYNRQHSINTLQHLHISNISNIFNNNEKSPQIHALSPYKKSQSMFKKIESFNGNKQLQMNQNNLQSQIFFKQQISKIYNEKTSGLATSKLHQDNQSAMPTKQQIKNEEKNIFQIPKIQSKILNKPKHKNNLKKSKNKFQKIKMNAKKISSSNHDVYEQQLKKTIQKVMKLKLKKQESQEIAGIYMQNYGPSSFCRNSNNYQQADLLMQKMVLIESQLLFENQRYLEAAFILTQQLENEYYFDPTFRHRFLQLLQKSFSKLNIKLPQQLKSMIGCYNKGILYKIGLLSLCKSKKNKYKTYKLTRQIISSILVKPLDQFSLLTFKNNMFNNLFQQISKDQINSMKDSFEINLMQIYEEDLQIQPIQITSQGQEPYQFNQQKINKHMFNNQQEQNIQKDDPLLANQVRVQNYPNMLVKESDNLKQNHINTYELNLLSNKSKDNIQSFQFTKEDSSSANFLQLNSSNFQQTLMKKIKSDNFSFLPAINQTSLQDIQSSPQKQNQSLNIYSTPSYLKVKQNSSKSDSNLLQFNQQSLQLVNNNNQNLDQKKEFENNLNEIQDIKLNNQQEIQQKNIFNQNNFIFNNSSPINKKQDLNLLELKHKQSQNSSIQDQQCGKISEYHSQLDRSSFTSSDEGSVNHNTFTLKHFDEDFHSEENSILENEDEIISIEQNGDAIVQIEHRTSHPLAKPAILL